MGRDGQRLGRWALLVCAVVGPSACGDEGATAPPDGGAAGATPDAGGGGPDAGPLPGPCEAGELVLDDDRCVPAGVPPDQCGTGFQPDDAGGCRPVLPLLPCPAGTMALPGETECREIAPCGSQPWEGIPVDGTTQYVDATYGGGTSDGTASQPWTTIQEGIDAAAPGAIVAVAAGSYLEDLRILQHPVKLWGTCPDQVEVVGDLDIYPVVGIIHTDGTELHQLAITGPSFGVSIRDAADVVLDRVWIHHTELTGLKIICQDAETSVDLRDSLIERVVTSGADVWGGALLRVADSVIRDGQSHSGDFGRGLSALTDDSDMTYTRLEVRRSLLEYNRETAIEAYGSDVLIEDTVIRQTYASEGWLDSGMGIVVAPDLDHFHLPTFELRRSFIHRSHSSAVVLIDAAATVEHVTIVETKPQPLDGLLGYGLTVASELPAGSSLPVVTIRQSAVRDSHAMGVGLAGAEAVVEGLLVRDTAPEEGSGMAGRGLAAQIVPLTGVGSTVAIRGTRIEASHEVGLLVLGSEATLDGVAIRDTAPRPSDGLFGRGVIVQASLETLAQSTLTMRHSLVEDSVEVGLFASGADIIAEDSTVRRSLRRESDGSLGDGVGAALLELNQGLVPTSLLLERCAVEQSDRAGIASFGAQVALSASRVDCNAIALNGETYADTPYEFLDMGANVCGCAAELNICQVLTSGLSPPEPMGQ